MVFQDHKTPAASVHQDFFCFSSERSDQDPSQFVSQTCTHVPQSSPNSSQTQDPGGLSSSGFTSNNCETHWISCLYSSSPWIVTTDSITELDRVGVVSATENALLLAPAR